MLLAASGADSLCGEASGWNAGRPVKGARNGGCRMIWGIIAAATAAAAGIAKLAFYIKEERQKAKVSAAKAEAEIKAAKHGK